LRGVFIKSSASRRKGTMAVEMHPEQQHKPGLAVQLPLQAHLQHRLQCQHVPLHQPDVRPLAR